MTCPTKRRNSPIASHFGEKASPQRVGAPATGPPNPKQARPKQHDHPNPAGPTKATGPPKPKQPRTKQKPHQNHNSTNHSNRTTQIRQARTKQQDRLNQSSPEQTKAAPNKAKAPPKPQQHQPQQQDHPNPAAPTTATGPPNQSSTNRRTGPAQPWPALPLHPTTGISARSVRRFGVRCSERARHCSCMEPSTESLTVLGP